MSASTPDLHLLLLWHQHQPSYRDPLTRMHLLPWVRLHALKDYYDMAWLVRQHPKLRCTINLVPILLDQLEALAAEPHLDAYAALARKEARTLSDDERRFLCEHFFSLPHATMLYPHRPYRDLLARVRMHLANRADRGARLADQDARDLQTWFYLAWSGTTLRRDPVVAALFKQGENFSEHDKAALFDAGDELLRKTLPLHRLLGESGQVELSCSPFAHPILPLLCTTEAALEANPHCRLPIERFSHVEDGREHITRAVGSHTARFGRAPVGMWPSEGSVSDAVVDLVHECGVRWLATDDGLLARTLGRNVTLEDRCRPHIRRGVSIFFRDHGLSDRVGFVYSRMSPEQAVNDFMGHLEAIRRDVKPSASAPPPVVTVALDGENAWEYYPGGGYDFLDALYSRLERTPWLETTTPTVYVDRYAEVLARGPQLARMATGSWIDGHFGTWIGDPAKNAAWDALTQARRTVGAQCRATLAGELHRAEKEVAAARRAMDCLLAAEGSDWFWWFGKGHTSLEDAEFDSLFRRYLRAAYQLVGLRPPASLETPIDPANRSRDNPTASAGAFELPTGLVSPAITGRVESYYKWVGAGRYDLEQGALHQADPALKRLYFGLGCDASGDRCLFLRVDGSRPLAGILTDNARIVFVFSRPETRRLVVEPCADARYRIHFEDAEGTLVQCTHGSRVAVDRVLEAALKLECVAPSLSQAGQGEVELCVILEVDAREMERLPRDRNVDFHIDVESLAMDGWRV